MIEVRPFASLGGANHGWLDAKHHFSFGSHHDPKCGWVGVPYASGTTTPSPRRAASASPACEHGDHHLCPRGRHHP